MSTDDIAKILKKFDELPDDAVVPSRVTAAVHGVSERTVRRTYPSVQLSPNVPRRKTRHHIEKPRPRGALHGPGQ
jgi:hypothetical protein